MLSQRPSGLYTLDDVGLPPELVYGMKLEQRGLLRARGREVQHALGVEARPRRGVTPALLRAIERWAPAQRAYAYDAHTNGAYSSVAVAPTPATSGTTVTVSAGDGTLFPDPGGVGAYNFAMWANGQIFTKNNGEIARTAGSKSGDQLTGLTRAQETTSARAVLVGDQISIAASVKSFTDIEVHLAAKTRYLPLLAATSFLAAQGSPVLAGVGSDNASTTVPAWAFPTGGTSGVATMVTLPADWDGGAITVQLIWAPSNTNGSTFPWIVDATTLTPGDLVDKNIVNSTGSTVTPSGTAKAYQSPPSYSFTPAVNFFRLLIYRNGGSFTGSAWLFGVLISYTAIF